MKILLILTTVLSLSTSAFAATQTKSNVRAWKGKVRTRAEFLPPKPVTSTISSTINSGNNSVADISQFTPSIHAGYTGIMNSPRFVTDEPEYFSISNRLSALTDITANWNAGIQARINTEFKSTGLEATSDKWRIFSTIKNIYNDGIFNFSLTPRVALPTSTAAIKATMIAGPELIASLNGIVPDSRFNFSYTAQGQKNFYSNVNANPKALNYYFLQSIGAGYTLTPSAEINISYNPEYGSSNSAAWTNSSNEIDLGMNWDFAKGWSVNPYIAAEMNGFSVSDAGRKLSANLILSGNFL